MEEDEGHGREKLRARNKGGDSLTVTRASGGPPNSGRRDGGRLVSGSAARRRLWLLGEGGKEEGNCFKLEEAYQSGEDKKVGALAGRKERSAGRKRVEGEGRKNRRLRYRRRVSTT